MKKSDRPKKTSKAKAKRPAPAGQSSRALLDLAAGIGRTDVAFRDLSTEGLRLADEYRRLQDEGQPDPDAIDAVRDKMFLHALDRVIAQYPDDQDLVALRVLREAEDHIAAHHDREYERIDQAVINTMRRAGWGDDTVWPPIEEGPPEARELQAELERRREAIKKDFMRRAGLSDAYIDGLFSMKVEGDLTLHYPDGTTKTQAVPSYVGYLSHHAWERILEGAPGVTATKTGEAIH